MGLKRTIVRNTLWNWTGMAVSLAAGFYLMRFLIQTLGEETYGFWLIIGSVTGYFGLLDFGIRGSVGRYLAYYRGKQDAERASRSLSTAFTILWLAALAVLAGVMALLPFFGGFFGVPAEELRSAQIALMLSGINLALFFPLGLFDGTLWALERFDLINMVDIGATAVRVGSTVVFVQMGYGLVALAGVTLGTMLLASAVKYILARRCAPELRLALRIQPEYVRELFTYGVWNFVASVAGRIMYYTSNVIIGRVLGSFFVTLYAPASQLTLYAVQLSYGMTGVFTPLLTGLHARSEKEGQRTVFLNGTRTCLLFGLFFLTGALALGQDLIRIWLRKASFDASYPVLCVLAVGSFLEMAIGMAPPVLLSTAKNRSLAALAGIELTCSIALTVVLVRPLGIMGVAIALAAPRLLTYGVLLPRIVCRSLGIGIGDFVRGTVLPTALWAAPGVMMGYAMWLNPTVNLGIFLAKACLLSIPFGLAFWFGALTKDQRRLGLNLAQEKWHALRASEGPEA